MYVWIHSETPTHVLTDDKNMQSDKYIVQISTHNTA